MAEPAIDIPAAAPPTSLDENLVALDIGDRTRDQVVDAAPKGRVVRQLDGNPALEVDGKTLGMLGDVDSRGRTLANIAAAKNCIVVVLGLGLGHAVREIRAHSTCPILVYEPDAGLLRTVLEWGPSDLGGVGIATDWVDLRMHWGNIRTSRPEVILVCTPGYKQAYPGAEETLADTVQSLIANTHVDENTHYLRARTWVTDILHNLDHAVGTTSFLALRNHYRGVPAFIVGAGPSLQKNVALLKEAGKKGIVFAVNTSGRALGKNGVTPHVLACLESIDLSADIAGVPFIDDVVRAFSMAGSPANMTAGRGPLLPTYEGIRACTPLVDLLGEPGLAVGASVTTSTFMLAERLGCDPIVLVGQDLAFTGNQAYAAGTRYEGSTVDVETSTGRIVHNWTAAKIEAHGKSAGALPDSAPAVHADAWGGEGTVVSTTAFTAVRDWLATAAYLLVRRKPEARPINATEGGARIPHFQEQTLAEVLADLPDCGITSQSIAADAAKLGKAVTRAQVRSWAETQLGRVEKAKEAAVLVDKLVKKALSELDTNQPEAVTRSFRRLESAEKGLRQACTEQPFIEAWSSAELQRITFATKNAKIEKSSHAEAAHALASEAKIADMVIRTADELSPLLTEVIQKHSA